MASSIFIILLFNSLFYMLFKSGALILSWLSIFNCFSPWTLIAFNCSSFLPLIVFNHFKSPFLSFSSNPLLKILPNGKYSNLTCSTTPG